MIFDLKRWKIRFGQHVLRIAWKARFVQFSWKAYCFHVLALISVLCAILGFGTLKNAIWPKRPAHDLKSSVLYNFHTKAYWRSKMRFSRIGVNFSPVEFRGQFHDFENVWRSKMRFGQNVLRIAWKARFYNAHRKPIIFTYWCEFQSGRAIFGSETLRNAIWSERPPHGLKSTFCTIFIQSLQFSHIGVNFSPVERFLDLKRWKIRFGQNVLRIAWTARFVQFSWKAYCFHVLL